MYVTVSLVALSYTAGHRLHTVMGMFTGISAMFISALILTLPIGERA